MIKYALQSRSNTYLLDEWCFTGFYEFELVELEDTLRKIRPIYRRFEFRIVTILVENPYERCLLHWTCIDGSDKDLSSTFKRIEP